MQYTISALTPELCYISWYNNYLYHTTCHQWWWLCQFDEEEQRRRSVINIHTNNGLGGESWFFVFYGNIYSLQVIFVMRWLSVDQGLKVCGFGVKTVKNGLYIYTFHENLCCLLFKVENFWLDSGVFFLSMDCFIFRV